MGACRWEAVGSTQHHPLRVFVKSKGEKMAIRAKGIALANLVVKMWCPDTLHREEHLSKKSKREMCVKGK